MTQDRLYLRPESFYAEQGITLRLGQAVTAIDTDARTVSYGDEVLPYDQLALTTGSVPRRLPSAIGGDLDGVYEVRTLADVDAMAQSVNPGARALIVGGGYIGLEAAAVAAKKDMQVVLVEMADRILQRVAAPQTSAYFRKLHGDHGVDIREGVGLSRLLGEGHVTGAELTDGTVLEVDLVIVGVGIAPATDLAAAAGLRIDDGIWTDAFGRTSDPRIWAAGDCCSFPHGSGRLRLESVPNAIDQAEVVAQNMLGAEVPYQATPWFWSDQYDVKLQIAGLNAGYTEVVERRTDDLSVSFWYFADGRLIAVDAMNDPRAYMVGKRLIEANESADPAVVADPASNLKALLTT
ncbi:MAG: FAD-dependent oxidoreductase [Pseudomonadota bacterium]